MCQLTTNWTAKHNVSEAYMLFDGITPIISMSQYKNKIIDSNVECLQHDDQQLIIYSKIVMFW